MQRDTGMLPKLSILFTILCTGGWAGADAAPLAGGAAELPVACTEGRPLGGGGAAGLPALEIRRCVHTPLHPGGLAWSVMYFDPLTAELYRVGGNQPTSVVISTARMHTRPRAHGEGVSPLLPNPDKWPKRTMGTGVFDPVARRLVYYGGFTDTNLLNLSAYAGDTLVLDLDDTAKGWVPLAIAPPGAPRYWARSIYDPVAHRMLVYGGRGKSASVGNQTVSLDLTKGSESWSVLEVAAAPPGASERIIHALAYDAARHRAVLCGGGTAYGGSMAYDDLWVLDLLNTGAGWKELVPINEGPGPGIIGADVFCVRASGDCYLHSGTVFDPPSSYGKKQPVEYLTHVWRIQFLPNDTFEWTRVRTSTRAGALLRTQVFWSDDLRRGLSVFGMDLPNESYGYLYTSRELLVYALTDVEP